LHDLCIYLAERLCIKKGYKILNGKSYADRTIYPGLPDVYIEVMGGSTTRGGRRVNYKMRYVIEIETHSTKQATDKKRKQFQSDGVTDLLIIPLNKAENQRDWVILEKFIEGHLP